MDYAKYLKYKKKYLMLKNSIGGSNNEQMEPNISTLIEKIQLFICNGRLCIVSRDNDNIYIITVVNYDNFNNFIKETAKLIQITYDQLDKEV